MSDAPVSSLVTGWTPGAARNNFTGEAGVRFFGVGALNLTISWIGVYCNVASGTRKLNLYDSSDVLQRTVTISLAGQTVGQYVWAFIKPLTLPAGSYCTLMQEVTASDGLAWRDIGPVTVTTDTAYAASRVTGGPIVAGLAGNMYVGVDLGIAENGFGIDSNLVYSVFTDVDKRDVATLATNPPNNPPGYDNWYGTGENVSSSAPGVIAVSAAAAVSIATTSNVVVAAAGSGRLARVGTALVTANQTVPVAPAGVAAAALAGTASVSIVPSVALAGTAAVAAFGTATVTAKQFVIAVPNTVEALAVLGTVTVVDKANASTVAAGASAISLVGDAVVTLGSGDNGFAIDPGLSYSIYAVVNQSDVTALNTTPPNNPVDYANWHGIDSGVSVVANGAAAPAALGTATATGKRYVTALPTGVVVTTARGNALAIGQTKALPAGLTAPALAGTATATVVRNASVLAAGQPLIAGLGIPAITITLGGVGVWTGTAWVKKPVRQWSGSAWVAKPVKRWNGGAWV